MADERSVGPVDRALGARVRLKRLDVGMSQEALADAIGVTFQQVQKYEKGVNRIAASRLCDICEALDTDIADMFTGIHQVAKKRGAKDSFAALDTPGAPELLKAYADIDDPDLRKRVLALVRTMTAKAKA